MSRVFDAEANVLGGCILVPEAYWVVADLLGEDDFSSDQTRTLWRAISELSRSHSPIDVFTVADKEPSVSAFAMECANATPSAANIRAYAEAVSRDAIIRRVKVAGQRIAKLAGDDTLGEAQRLLGACAPRMASNIKHAREYLRQSVRMMQDRCDATEILTGVPTSLDWLDEITSGWQRGDLILVGARPSVGKTALALQAAAHAAKSGHATLFLSLEMAGAQLTDRLLSHLSGVNGQFIRQPKTMPEECWGRILDAGGAIEGMPLLIEDTSALTLEGVCARVRQANAMRRLGLVVLDYLTCMTPPKAEKLTDGIQMITRGLKALAKELRVPIVLLSQLNRAGGEHRPNLSSLRESGAIEQDADVVLFLHRPNDAQRHLIECIVAKQRNGPVGETYMHFNGETQRFMPTEEKPQSAQVVNIAKPRRGMTRFIDKSAGE